LHGNNFYPGTGKKLYEGEDDWIDFYPAGIYNYPIKPG
jgi:hypothetical protein